MFNLFGKSNRRRAINGEEKKKVLSRLLAKYDAAQTTSENQRHWINADDLGPNLSASPQVRKTLRNRSRYEVANDAYLSGMLQTLCDYQIGSGPRLQIHGVDVEASNYVEDEFHRWCKVIDLPRKLWTMRFGRAMDGESFALLVNNPKLKTQVKLDVVLIEPEMVATPPEKLSDENIYDGIEYDNYGNVEAYYVLTEHPKDGNAALSVRNNWRRYPADNVIHWYHIGRPGQKRGIPETTPILTVGADLRRYRNAVISAAEIAALLAMVLYTDAPAGGEAQEVEPMDTVLLERRLATVLPEGWKLGQAQAEQPTTTYSEFVREKLNEMARAFSLPFNVAIGNSAGYNYASGRLDYQSFFRKNRVEQKSFIDTVMDKIFATWMAEAVLRESYIPLSIRTLSDYDHDWFFETSEYHVDPNKESAAQERYLKNMTTTYAAEYAKQGKDWQTEFEQIAKEKREMERLNITPNDIKPSQPLSEDERDA